MVNQFREIDRDNNPKFIVINGKEVMCKNPEQWNGFMRWVEETHLFHAIKEGVKNHKLMGVSYYIVRAVDVELNINTSIDVNKADDLPIEILQNFFLNSPWHKQLCGDDIQQLLTDNK